MVYSEICFHSISTDVVMVCEKLAARQDDPFEVETCNAGYMNE